MELNKIYNEDCFITIKRINDEIQRRIIARIRAIGKVFLSGKFLEGLTRKWYTEILT